MTDTPTARKLRCLVTRPAHQNAQLKRWAEDAGFEVLLFPTIEIVPAADNQPLLDLQQRIDDYDIALFVSRNAVDFTFKTLDASKLPEHLTFGVIGSGTQRALESQGLGTRLVPATTYNSEGLLESEALKQVDDKRIVIFRGQEGRNLLGDTLQQRGALVDYCEVYRRQPPAQPAPSFAALTRDGFPDIAIFTSAEGLHNTPALMGPESWQDLCAIPWLLISERMRETALVLGHNAPIIIAQNASDSGILQTLKAWQQRGPDTDP